eukprot:TRINITY_DN22489_c0_g1_i2.p1 TRINITY_DN22489_c0_g1~~TRINITY_DN22489_c0_g1_i2.p1  ORF type:complete len:112 (-),score=29.06 TRINITY_DN22489_c0_g1_i2:173-508(-)
MKASLGYLTPDTLASCGVKEEPFVLVARYRGIAWSRIIQEMLGSAEYKDARPGQAMCWPDGYSSHYIEEFNVKPTQLFIDYINSFDLEAFKAAVAKVTACVAEKSGIVKEF